MEKVLPASLTFSIPSSLRTLSVLTFGMSYFNMSSLWFTLASPSMMEGFRYLFYMNSYVTVKDN